MSNEVNITITATDLSGPAFSKALANMALLKAAAKDVASEFKSVGEVKLDPGAMTAGLNTLKSKIQSLGIADIADVNVQPGRITVQLNLLKRLIQQAKISDVLDINANMSDLQAQLDKIAGISETIPINFRLGDIPKLPVLGETVSLSGGAPSPSSGDPLVAVTQDLTKATATLTADTVGLASVTQSLASDTKDLTHATVSLTAATAPLQVETTRLISATEELIRATNLLTAATRAEKGSAPPSARFFVSPPSGPPTVIPGSTGQNIQDRISVVGLQDATNQTNMLKEAFAKLITTKDQLSSDVDQKLNPSVKNAGNGLAGLGLAAGVAWGWFGRLNVPVTLFGGALNKVPLLGAVGGIHLLVESIAEFLGTIIPATVALVSFGAYGAPTVQHIAIQMQNLWTTTQALNQSIYPITKNMMSLGDAVKPEIYQLFGEALVLVNAKAGEFSNIAAQAGHVVDSFGARIVSAMVSGNGFSTFLQHSSSDLAGWFNVIGNLGGIIGNVLKVLPGYAEIILSAFGTVTHAIENITGSKFGQWALNIGLAAHGAIIWIGLLTTGFALLSKALLGVAASGLTGMAGMVVKLGASGAGAAIGLDRLAVSLRGISAAQLGWIGLAVAAIGFLIFKIVTAKDAIQQWGSTLNQSIQSSSISGGMQAISAGQVLATQKLNGALQTLGHTQEFVAERDGRTGDIMQNRLGPAYQQAVKNVSDYKNELNTLNGFAGTYSVRLQDLAKQYGGTNAAQALLVESGVSMSDMLNKSGASWDKIQVEVAAAADQFQAMQLGTGRAGAAMNALNFAGDTTSNTLGSLDVDMQKITQAQDAMTNVILGGEQAFISFQQNVSTAVDSTGTKVSQMGKDAKVAGASVGGLNTQSLALSNDFYSTAIPSFQKVIDSLQMQLTSTKDLTAVVATGSGQLLTYAGNNTAARATIVAMINDALGPGTVSLQSLNKWVKDNSTSLQGFNTIVAQSTIKAGSLANLLQNDLNAQFQQALLKSSGASQQINNFANAITHGGTSTAAYHNARQQLIKDLENSGFSAKDATTYVDGLQQKINSMHGKTVDVGVHASGGGSVDFVSHQAGSVQIFSHPPSGGLNFFSEGGFLPGFGGGDKIPAMLEAGETVVDKYKTRDLAWLFKFMGVKGFASGGLVGSNNIFDSPAPFAANAMHNFGVQVENVFVNDSKNSVWAAWLSAVEAAANSSAIQAKNNAALNFAFTSGNGPANADAAQAQAYAHSRLASGLYGWGLGNFPPLVALWNQESGWNRFATNPTSGAYGIPQALPPGKMGAAANPPQSSAAAQIDWGLAYIRTAYGTPFTAEQHELAVHWYDKGGWLKPGLNLAMNGTGSPEWVSPAASSQGGTIQLEVSGGASSFEDFMAEFIRNYVRIKGGGDVQKTFGRK